MGKVLFAIGLFVGGVNYLVTCAYFFSTDNEFLGLVLLVVPPAELVLPWVASMRLGLMSLVGIACMAGGTALSRGE